jgi:hypothetical protein
MDEQAKLERSEKAKVIEHQSAADVSSDARAKPMVEIQ